MSESLSVISEDEVTCRGRKFLKQTRGIFGLPRCYVLFECPFTDTDSMTCCPYVMALHLNDHIEDPPINCWEVPGTRCGSGMVCKTCCVRLIGMHNMITRMRAFVAAVKGGWLKVRRDKKNGKFL